MRFAFFSLVIFTFVSGLFAAPDPPEPVREFRGTWVASVFNLDWPSSSKLSAAAQQAELINILNRAQRLRLNAVILQVRPSSDALYRSSYEPWSAFLTGRMGGDPGYDPLAFAVAEAHKRGLQLHAWFNPFRALATKTGGVAPNHISQRRPQWIVPFGTQLWLDPGIPEAREYVVRVILDAVSRYDIDGVHLDDYFYPYPIAGRPEFPDAVSWRRYGQGSGMTRSEWRRENVNHFVRDLYGAIKSEKRDVLFGISPFGIWRPGVPATISAGLDAYETLCADSRKWLQNGWVDYLAPQLYWPIQPAEQSFPVLLRWWADQNEKNRHLWPGIATERIGSNRPAAEQIRQIQFVRRTIADPGHIHWSNKSLARNQGGIATLLAQDAYSEPAVVPASPWLDRDRGSKPSLKLASNGAGQPAIDWAGGGSDKLSGYLVQWQTPAGWQSQIAGARTPGMIWPNGATSVAVRSFTRTGMLSPVAWLER
ncbi:MAG TPA: family 10 glycosylhydrolase [Chthoniobacterales bacterium]